MPRFVVRWVKQVWWAWAWLAMPCVAQTAPREPSPALRLPLAPASALERGLGNLTFTAPVALVTPPGESNRLFVVEQSGRIVVVTNLAAPTRTVFLDLSGSTVFGGEQGLLGLAFHPRYADTGRFFVFRTVRATTRGQTNRLHDRLSEFRVSDINANRAATAETILFQQYDEASNHNGGDLHFGSDGFLYVAVGDEGGGNDQYRNGQTITRDFFAGLLRLDVDARPESLLPNVHPANEAFLGNYRIPADNPFVGATQFLGRPIAEPDQIRTEFFVVGLRNPWRFSFDPANGDLWIADVGQGARESIYLSRRGANHGWPFREGPIAGPRSGAPVGFLSDAQFQHVPPLHSYSHGSGPTQGRSVTGGLVYRGSRFPALSGAYVFADYVSGNVWSLRRTDAGGVVVERILGETGLAGFGRDPRNGDLLVADLDGSRVLRLLPGATGGEPIPTTLAETGAFSNLRDLVPTAGVEPYDVNLPFWSDGAEKRRWFHIPGTQQITYREMGGWETPPGTVWVKHFELPLGPEPSDPRQRVETRFLVRQANGVYGITYRWNSATNAVLVGDEGATQSYEVRDGHGTRVVQWRFPSRAECLSCHNASAGGSLSFDSAQLSRTVMDGAGVVRNQIERWAEAGYFSSPPRELQAVRRHPELRDETVTLTARARSYLAVNCAPCHRPGGALGGGFFDLRLETSTAAAALLGGPLNDTGGIDGAQVVVAGVPERSMLLHRVETAGPGRMPPVSSGEVDRQGVDLLRRWIGGMSEGDAFSNWLRARFGEAVAAAADRSRDGDGDGATDYLEYLTGTDPQVPGDGWRLRMAPSHADGLVRLQYHQPSGVGVRLERAVGVGADAWQTAEEVAISPEFPVVAKDREVTVPVGEGPAFFRARVVEP